MAIVYFNKSEKRQFVYVDGKTTEKHKNLEGCFKYHIFKAKKSDVVKEYQKHQKIMDKFEKETGFRFKGSDYSISKMSEILKKTKSLNLKKPIWKKKNSY